MTSLRRWLRRHAMLHRLARAARGAARAVGEPIRRRGEIVAWRLRGSPVPPPPAVKQEIVGRYARAFGLTTLVETGTYLGEMVEAQRRQFERVWSIELSPELFRAAQDRFSSTGNVTLLEGDSGELITSVVQDLKGPALFWLDGHYSAGNTARGSLETPVQRELEAILGGATDHVILVDDARCFGTGDYPSLDAVRALVAAHRPGWTCAVDTDVIRIHANPRTGSTSGEAGSVRDSSPTRPQ